jgi:hypothetical protein
MARSRFKFKKNDQIGAAGAEEDAEYLETCFVDTGDLAYIENASDRRQILLGRTGSGKTALLMKLEAKHPDEVINVSPENLALSYVSNSTILSFFSSIGVNLDPFFRLLWRHVFTVEILKRYFLQHPVPGRPPWLERLKEMFSGSSRHEREMQEAIRYLDTWGSSFWQETEFRVKEITSKVEGELDAQLQGTLGMPGASLSSSTGLAEKLSQTQRAELNSRGQEIISHAQVQDLHKVMLLLDSVLSDRKKQYYIVIDKLDENWVEERVRYKLIMALLQTARDFFEVRNAKVIIAVRRDLIERVFRLTRDSGFQEEKYQSLYLPLVWRKHDLVKVLDSRVGALVARRYTKQRVTHVDLLPRHFGNMPVTDYMMDRCERPRDVIAFFNACISAGANLERLTTAEFKDAEGHYSTSRLRALGDEWSADFPSLLEFTKILQRRSSSFKISSVTERSIEDVCLEVAAEHPGGAGILQQHAMKVVDEVDTAASFRVFLMRVFYRIGLIGLKLQPYEPESWVDERGRGISSAEISENVSVVIHPAYHRALGVGGGARGVSEALRA